MEKKDQIHNTDLHGQCLSIWLFLCLVACLFFSICLFLILYVVFFLVCLLVCLWFFFSLSLLFLSSRYRTSPSLLACLTFFSVPIVSVVFTLSHLSFSLFSVSFFLFVSPSFCKKIIVLLSPASVSVFLSQ